MLMVKEKHSMNIAKGFLRYEIVKKEGSVTNSNQNILLRLAHNLHK